MATADWSSLPSDLTNRVADIFLATNDVDYYMDFRAVCHNWRNATDDPRKSSGADSRFHPNRWIFFDVDDHGHLWGRPLELIGREDIHGFLNIDTGRILHRHLPVLRDYNVFDNTTGGFVVVADMEFPRTVRILNPLIRCTILFRAPLPSCSMDRAVAVFGPSPTLLLCSGDTLYCADPDSNSFVLYEEEQAYPLNRLAVAGGVYVGDRPVLVPPFSAPSVNRIVELMSSYDVNPYSTMYGGDTNHCFLVRSDVEILFIVMIREQHRFEVFKVDTDKNVCVPVKSIGDRAIFLADSRCVSVNAGKVPSIDPNCIYYYLKGRDGKLDIYMYGLEEERVQKVSGFLHSHDFSPPFTIIQLLCCYTMNVRITHWPW